MLFVSDSSIALFYPLDSSPAWWRKRRVFQSIWQMELWDSSLVMRWCMVWTTVAEVLIFKESYPWSGISPHSPGNISGQSLTHIILNIQIWKEIRVSQETIQFQPQKTNIVARKTFRNWCWRWFYIWWEHVWCWVSGDGDRNTVRE